MVLDGLRGYIQLANGLTDVTKERARAAARALVAQGPAVGAALPQQVRGQVTALTEDLLATSKANRDLLVGLVRTEVDKSVARLGLVSAQDLQAFDRKVRGLERRVDELEKQLRTSKRTARKATTKRTAAKKTAAKKTATGTSSTGTTSTGTTSTGTTSTGTTSTGASAGDGS